MIMRFMLGRGDPSPSLRVADLPLEEGEDPDLRQEAIAIAGRAWLDTPNPRLGGDRPDHLIEIGEGGLVRNLLRSIKHIGTS